MITPIIASTTATPVANVQQNTEAQSTLNTQNASVQIKEEERQVRETVVNKDEAVFYQQKHDAKEEGRNKYANLYSDKKKKAPSKENKEKDGVTRINFQI